MTVANQHRRLGVNVDHVATLRQARRTRYPCPVQAARQCVDAGADLITVHLREDARHIQEHDLRRLLDENFCRVNLEISPTAQMVDLACRYRPGDCCLVPEKREELTTEGGLDAFAQHQQLRPLVARLHDAGIRVSLFIEPELSQLEAAVDCGAGVVELHTGAYADAADPDVQLTKIAQAARQGQDLGLQVNAGHGLNFDNLGPVAEILTLAEFNIGHFVVCQALFVGFDAVVGHLRKMLHRPFSAGSAAVSRAQTGPVTASD